MNEKQLIDLFNKHTFEELIPLISQMLEMGSLTEEENGLVSIWSAGWSDDEMLIDCLRSYRCKHHYNYIGNVYAVFYFARDKDKKWDFNYEIIATPRDR